MSLSTQIFHMHRHKKLRLKKVLIIYVVFFMSESRELSKIYILCLKGQGILFQYRFAKCLLKDCKNSSYCILCPQPNWKIIKFMIEAKYHMACGCILLKSRLVLRNMVLCCPEHLQQTRFTMQPCSRCGLIIKSRAWNSEIVFCDQCYKLLSQAKTLRSYHSLPDLVDPILSRKSLSEITEDIVTNLFYGREAIQIDPPLRVQHESKPITIDLEQKIKLLKEELSCQHSLESH